ncbi:dihydroxyacetone kinase family protein [Tsukamurella asaccharolytica]|uniref:Dihydroxyacetone kinase family protein n=1 Tax=Tsukamurella asaccharolytica TaxID=2592067 RepID=A0A5C5R6T8_9ACTN|nr:dihydroxyacetone kinase family protein [Tsukamurella asaccharolytica]TWS18660.1 dihydroxyacetone kinase family protein [Tsukamurella asaccharolytica]
MTYLFNDPDDFKTEVLTGFTAAHKRHVRRVEGAAGFVRSAGPLEGKVALVIGGGSGHYPSYSGVVGTGFADGAVLGEVFASPSAEQVYRIARAADGGAGVVLGFGNYAGDRLNFAAAAERLIAEGVDSRIVYVTDDIASAAPESKAKRRGIAGTFTVYKIAGAAAERGDDLDGVERVMRRANDATYSFGVAFNGCTLPGADEPLFRVDAGKMDLGLGIHGEPGISSLPVQPAAELARTLVERVLAERPADADGRAAVLVNGLGSTKYEELYVLFGTIAEELGKAGVELIAPEVGELVTSLDMAGCSLSITWLDDELAELWQAPADTPAFRSGVGEAVSRFQPRDNAVEQTGPVSREQAGQGSIEAAVRVRQLLQTMLSTIEENRADLGQLDAVAGDGDHGIGMARGAAAAVEAADQTEGGVGQVLEAAGGAFGDKAGGTSGILWGHLLTTLGRELGNADRPDDAAVGNAVDSAVIAVRTLGKAEPGDKTMLDAMLPFAERLDSGISSGESLAEAWAAAASESTRAAYATAELSPRVGRARPLAERSIGHPDPGAVSFALIVTAVAAAVSQDGVAQKETEQ